MIELGRGAAILARHPGRKQCGGEAKLTQQGGKGAVQFIAEAAAVQFHDFVQEALLVTRNGAFERDIEIFEGNGVEMGEMQRAQGFSCWRSGAGVVDAREVSRKIHPTYWMLSFFWRLCLAQRIWMLSALFEEPPCE